MPIIKKNKRVRARRFADVTLAHYFHFLKENDLQKKNLANVATQNICVCNSTNKAMYITYRIYCKNKEKLLHTHVSSHQNLEITGSFTASLFFIRL